MPGITSAWLVPLANLLKAATGSWHTVFVVSAAGNALVVLAALLILRPMRVAHHRAVTRAAAE